MPSVTLNKKVILEIIGKNLSDEELANAISYVGTDLEGINGDDVNVEIFPNRPDMLSEQGLGRALASYLGTKTGLSKYEIKKSEYKLIVDYSAKGIRPNTACAVVKGLKFNDEKIREIIQIQEKLHVTYGRNRKKVAIGIYPMEKIKFPITLFAEDPNKIKFVPLESPGNIEMTGQQILSKHQTGREYGFLLEGLKKYPFFKDATGNILSMPPIINSESTGRINENTTDVFIECSGFNQKVLDICLNMIVSALSDMGGEIYSIELTNKVENFTKVSPNLEPTRMTIDVNYVNKLLGITLTEKEMELNLNRMGFGYDSKSKEALVPSYRSDILHPADLVEDIAIAYGYFKFEREIPNCPSIGKLNSTEALKSIVGNILSGVGLFETNTYCLIGDDQIGEKILSENPIVRLANSVTEGYNSMRNSVIPSLLLVLKNNKHNDYPQGFFEIGNTFFPDISQETKVKESKNLAFVYSDRNADYTYAKQVLDYLMNNLNLSYKTKTTSENKTFLEGRYAKIIVENEQIGYVGQINPEVIVNFDLEMPVCGFEINFEKLVEFIKESNK